MQENSLASSQLSVLVVDPNPGIRASLQNMLNQSGISRVEYAGNAGSAVRQLARREYDAILCEYDLGGGTAAGQDGQQLLEDLRHHKLIPPWAIFIMLTSEAAQDKVIGAAELQPTEYILKPYTPETLHQRIQRALARRAALLPAYQLAAQGDPRAAIRICVEAAAAQPRYALDFARLRAELHASLKEHEQAEAVYRELVAARPLGWARLGLARSLAAQGRGAEALSLLEQLVRDNPRLMAAYDLLARCQAERGEHAQAQKTLEEAVGISPHMVRRLRKLGEVALAGGDLEAAEKSFKLVVSRSRHSEFRDPEDHVNLVKALVRKGDPLAAAGVVRDLERSLRGTPELDACMAISNALLQDAHGNQAGAANDLRSAVTAMRAGSALSPGLKLGLTRSLLAHRMDAEASEVMLAALADQQRAQDGGLDGGKDGGLSAQQAIEVFVQAGRPDLAAGMGKQLRAQARILLGVADEKRNMGDVRGAVQTLMEALQMAPGNLAVMIALVGGILRQLMEMGWDHPLASLCAAQLEQIRALDPDHPRLKALDEEFLAARRKYGISS